MVEKTVIIAHRRRGSDYWKGYTERAETESNSWVDYFHSIGQIVNCKSLPRHKRIPRRLQQDARQVGQRKEAV